MENEERMRRRGDLAYDTATRTHACDSPQSRGPNVKLIAFIRRKTSSRLILNNWNFSDEHFPL